MSPKTDVIEVPDKYIIESIKELRNDMKDGFDRMERKFEEVVHKGEYQSTIERIDTEIGHVRSSVKAELEYVRRDVDGGFERIAERDAVRDKKNSQRMTASIALAGVVSGVIFGILTLIF